jgi:CxxC motif-containing protein (DUF1111 family)
MSALKAPAACRAESALLFLLLCLPGSCALAQDFSALDGAAGKALFERSWVQAPSSTTSADGLGPYYNARSCAACHPGGGGGSTFAALTVQLDDPVYGQQLQVQAIAGLPAEAAFVIENSCRLQTTLADGSTVELHCPRVAVLNKQFGPLVSATSLRRAPSLRGLAALAQVSALDLQVLADPEDRDGDGISGRLPLLPGASGTQPGRFGWKAQLPSLRAQIALALSLDLGLSTTLHPNPAGDCSPVQLLCLQAAGPLTAEPEVSDLMLDLLERYLLNLPPPVSVSRPDAEGAQLFAASGCAGCHQPELLAGKQLLRPYTDLLLHDMGELLADELAGVDTAPSEWRTPPLWGLGQVERFLHDGRAASPEEAIAWHGGEASGAREAYQKLNEDQRRLLLDWLQGL